MNIFVTGANGFVGRALCAEAISCGMKVRGGVRSACELPAGVESVFTGDMDRGTDWRNHLAGCDVVIHLAARVHVMRDTDADPLDAYRRVNVQGSLRLAEQAAAAGVKRFVFISSIKVNGEMTQPGRPFRPDDTPAPQDPYGISKMEAEQGLLALSASTGMEVVVIRPPLVYGPGIKANFAAMTNWLRRGVPLPLGAIKNQRSLVALANLVDLILNCAAHPAAPGQIFLVSDGEDVSTTELLRRMSAAMGRPARLLPVPAACLTLLAAMVGKRDVAQRLCGSLQLDIEKTRRLLGWNPPVTMNEGLKKVAMEYEREAAV